MERLIKHITLIDTLGILLPGAILLLSVNYYGFWDVAAPWKTLFGDGDVPLLIYFTGLSYLCGSVIHQMGAGVEKLLTKGPLNNVNLHAKHWENEEIRVAYRTHFKDDPPVDGSAQTQKDLRKRQIAAGKKVFRTVQQGERPQRIVLFSAFYAMSRALVLTLACVAVMAWVYWGDLWNALPSVLLCVLGMVMFSWRWVQYEIYSVDEAYLIFGSMDKAPHGSDSKKP